MQRATSWVIEAAERAERRLRESGQSPPCQASPAQQLDSLVAAILDRRVSREGLRRIAKAMSGGGQ
jgi:hypothetical protein